MSELSDDEWCFYSGMPSPKAYEIEPLSKELLLERGHCCDNGCNTFPIYMIGLIVIMMIMMDIQVEQVTVRCMTVEVATTMSMMVKVN